MAEVIVETKEIRKNAPKVIAESNATEIPKEKDEPKKTRKPREKMRPYEELMSLSEKKLTDAEKNFLIKKLKEEVTLKTNQYNACHDVIDSSFAQNRQLEEDYKSMEAYYKDKLKYVHNQLNAFHSAINAVIKGGVQ